MNLILSISFLIPFNNKSTKPKYMPINDLSNSMEIQKLWKYLKLVLRLVLQFFIKINIS